jgi:hypothetical protein
MLLPSLLMTTEVSWLVKISLNGSINKEPLTQIRNSRNSVTKKKVLSSSLSLYWEVQYSFVSKYEYVMRILKFVDRILSPHECLREMLEKYNQVKVDKDLLRRRAKRVLSSVNERSDSLHD